MAVSAIPLAPAHAELVAALLAPIAGDNPSGADLRYDPAYDRLKEARREDDVLPAGGLSGERKIADWPLAVRLGTELLSTRTKDLQLGAWMSEALLRRDGVGGLAAGLEVLRGLIVDFWDTVYPELEDDDPELRTGPLEWVGGRLDIAVRQSAIAPGTSFLDYTVSRTVPSESESAGDREKRAARDEAVETGKPMPEAVDKAIDGANKSFYRQIVADFDAALAAVAALDVVCDEKFGRDAPSFTKLHGALDEVRRFGAATLARKLETDPDPIVEEPIDVGDGADGGQASSEGSAGAEGGPITAEPASPADAAARVAASARYLRQRAPTSPAPYLLLRGFRWGELRAAVGNLDPKLLEAPPTAVRTRLKTLLLDGRWAELLEQGEQLMATPAGRGWLDLQRYTLTACAHLGHDYDAIAAGVRGELRALLGALPQLLETTLMDDTPSANAETRAWLDAEGITAEPTDGEEPESAEEVSDDVFAAGVEVTADGLADEDAAPNPGGTPARRRRRVGAPGRRAEDGTPDAYELARTELAQGRPQRGIELLVRALAGERAPRGRFIRQVQIAGLMVEAGLDPVARPILERLLERIDEHKLDEWEAGPLVAQPMALLIRCLDKQQDQSGMREVLYLRVCRLDPLQAIPLQPQTY